VTAVGGSKLTTIISLIILLAMAFVLFAEITECQLLNVF
jgi:hypothetical protein